MDPRLQFPQPSHPQADDKITAFRKFPSRKIFANSMGLRNLRGKRDTLDRIVETHPTASRPGTSGAQDGGDQQEGWGQERGSSPNAPG